MKLEKMDNSREGRLKGASAFEGCGASSMEVSIAHSVVTAREAKGLKPFASLLVHDTRPS